MASTRAKETEEALGPLPKGWERGVTAQGKVYFVEYVVWFAGGVSRPRARGSGDARRCTSWQKKGRPLFEDAGAAGIPRRPRRADLLPSSLRCGASTRLLWLGKAKSHRPASLATEEAWLRLAEGAN
jgi:hypothetical protein